MRDLRRFGTVNPCYVLRLHINHAQLQLWLVAATISAGTCAICCCDVPLVLMMTMMMMMLEVAETALFVAGTGEKA